MKTRLTQSPNRVWNLALKNLGYTKPHIVCGENTEGENANFQWVGANDPVPKEGGVLLKDYREGKAYIEKGYKGAWFHHGRMVFVATVKQKGFICGPGFSAVTDYRYDWIAFCAHAFRPEAMNRISPKTYKEIDGKTKKQKERIYDKIAVGTPLRSIARHLSVTVLHELFHWYGFPKVNAQGQAIPDTYNIDDVHTVDKDGNYLYKRTASNQVDLKASKDLLSSKEMEEENLRIAVAYGQMHVWNLAKLLHGDKSIKPVGNADSMAYFALMVYLDAWNWSDDGIAAEKILERPS
ncbi:hypothetical protein FACUT_7814 [Fusarium acutatum]|uniref:Uncharacterized protein n=1 Tax=Fusarium acutatum TaxID=78861 RepID=A0A8H4JKX6_9HYPO|nr:hypothetical protein FACUT_7814 [Fusarium acutatum]